MSPHCCLSVQGEDQAPGNPNFWDEFFLLKPKVAALEAELNKLNAEQLTAVKDNVHTLFAKCVAALGHEHHMRVAHALQVTQFPFLSSFIQIKIGFLLL